MKANGFEPQKEGVKQKNVHTFTMDHGASWLPLDGEKRNVVNI